jgi:hypothetical protein
MVRSKYVVNGGLTKDEANGAEALLVCPKRTGRPSDKASSWAPRYIPSTQGHRAKKGSPL